MKPSEENTPAESTFDMNDLVLAHRFMSLALNTDFHRIFGKSLKPFWDNITGFDIVLFAEQFALESEEVTISDAIRAKYGNEASDLIDQLNFWKPCTDAQIDMGVKWVSEHAKTKYLLCYECLTKSREKG